MLSKFTISILGIILFFNVYSYTQTYEVYKGTQLSSIKRSFQEIEELDKLYPELKPQGRRVKNEIEKYPEMEVNPDKIIYQASKKSIEYFTPTKDPSPTPDADFLGLEDSGGSIPPDVNGAPGPEHLMVTLNTDIRIMDREGNPISTVGTGAFWHPTPGSGGVFDPKVSYDPFEDRWILIMPSSSDPASSRLMVAVSENHDPTGNWYMYSFDGDPDDTHWFDYPNYGFSKDKIIVSGNLFGPGGTYVALYVFDKAELYNNATLINYSRIKTYDGFTIVPAKTYDPDVEDIYMVHNAGGNSGGYGYINLWKVSGTAMDPLIENKGLIGVPEPWSNGSYSNGGNFAPQLGSDELINTVDGRMENMVYRNGKLWTAHHVYLPAGDPNRCSIQWWNLSLDGEILQWGRVDDPNELMYFAFASIAVNAKEDVLIGFGSFSEEQYASSSYAFRYADDPVNTLRDYYQYKNGLAPYFKTFGGERNRWGDYTSTFVDPVDDLDFWTLQEYAEIPPGSQDEWGTWWAYVNLDAVPEPDFTSNISEVPVGSGVNFEDLSKFTPTSWLWTFEGGTPATSSEQNPQNIVYNEEGLYDVTLVATNDMGSETIVMEEYINANTAILPEIHFQVSDTIPCTGDVVMLEDLTIYNPNEWLWEFYPDLVSFVNGTDANSQNPEVTFDYPYAYDVTLSAINNNGESTITKTSLVNTGGMGLPFFEDFESRDFSTNAWTIENPDEDKTWDIEAVGGSSGELAAYVNIKNYSGFEERDRLISPALNLFAHKEITFEFQYAYGQRISGMTDSLIVYISEDCGMTWTRILEMAENTEEERVFATTEPSSMAFIPEVAEDWCGSDINPVCVEFDLSAWSGKSNVHIMFETYNGYGNNLYIDNISIDGTLIGVDKTRQENNSIHIAPNPSQGIVYLSGEYVGNHIVNIYNISGKCVHSIEMTDLNSYRLDLSTLPEGLYLFEIKGENFVQVEKVVLK